MQIVALVSAAVIYAFGGIFMKHADGLRHLGWSLATFCAFGGAAVLQAWAMRGRELAVTYLLVLGLEGVIAAGFGFVLFHEEVTLPKVAGILLILSGIGLLRSA
jgi:multidrug transporter EmrE-like cation transporter